MSLQIHYNQDADLLTYLRDPALFEVKNGYVDALTGEKGQYHFVP